VTRRAVGLSGCDHQKSPAPFAAPALPSFSVQVLPESGCAPADSHLSICITVVTATLESGSIQTRILVKLAAISSAPLLEHFAC